MDEVLNELREKGKGKGMKASELFFKLDVNKDGFLDVNEFT